jgi:glycosyltransferase involved in cell wall biosynthesis
MRVAFIETSPYGGLLHYAVQLADAVAERGNAVDLIVTRGNELRDHDGSAEMRAVLTPAVRDTSPYPETALRRLCRRAGVGIRLVRCWARVVRTSLAGRYDLLVVNSDIYYTVVALAVLALTLVPGRKPIVLICHNAQPFRRGRDGELTGTSGAQRLLLSRLFPRLLLILVHGESSRAVCEATWPAVNLATIPHGDERLFADQAQPPSDEERTLFFGNWRRVKGIAVLTEAFDLLAARRPQSRLTIAGSPSPEDLDLPALYAWAAAHGDRVELIDRYVPVEEVPAIFARARVVVNPYLHAFQSGVVHLAMTMARAVVASDVGDLDAIVVDGETGLLVPAGDPVALADALERVLSDPALAQRMGEAGRARVLSGSGWETVAERFDSLVCGALAGER